MFASLGERTVFSKVNLSVAYQRVEGDKQSQQYLTINMQKGLYTYKVPMVLHISQKKTFVQLILNMVNMEKICEYIIDFIKLLKNHYTNLQE